MELSTIVNCVRPSRNQLIDVGKHSDSSNELNDNIETEITQSFAS